MTSKKQQELIEFQGMAMASFGLTNVLLRMLEAKKLLTPAEVSSLFVGLLRTLETDEMLADPAAQAAREVLAGLAKERGIQLRPVQ